MAPSLFSTPNKSRTTVRSAGPDAAGGPSPSTAAAAAAARRSRSPPSSADAPPPSTLLAAGAGIAAVSTPSRSTVATMAFARGGDDRDAASTKKGNASNNGKARSVDRARITVPVSSEAQQQQQMQMQMQVGTPKRRGGRKKVKKKKTKSRVKGAHVSSADGRDEVELHNDDGSYDGSSSDDESTGEDDDGGGFSDTDGASSSSDDDQSDASSSAGGYLQINLLDGKATHANDRMSPAPSPTPSRTRRSTATSRSAGQKMTLPLPPPPPPPPPPPSTDGGGDGCGPLQYPPGVPRHDRDRVLLPSPLPSPARAARKLWRRSAGSGNAAGAAPTSPATSSLSNPTTSASSVSRKQPKQQQQQQNRSAAPSYGASNDDGGNNPSDSSDGESTTSNVAETRRRQREDANLSRLVVMAKRQQSFAAAWFAASQGGANVQPPPPPPPPSQKKRRPPPPPPGVRQMSSGSSSESSAAGSAGDRRGGPIDMDSGESWDDDDDDDEEEGGGGGQSSVASCSSISGYSADMSQAPSEASDEQRRNKRGGRGWFAGAFSSDDGDGPCASASCVRAQQQRRGDVSVDLEKGGANLPVRASSTKALNGDDEDDLMGEVSRKSYWSREFQVGRWRVSPVAVVIFLLFLIIAAGAATIGTVATSDNESPPVQAAADGKPEVSLGGSTPPPAEADDVGSEDGAGVDVGGIDVDWVGSATAAPSETNAVPPTTPPTVSPTEGPAPTSSPTDAPTTSYYAATRYEMVGTTIRGLEPGGQAGYSIAMNGDASIMAVGSRYSAENGARAGEVRVYVLSPGGARKPGTRGEEGSGAGDGAAWVQLGQALEGRNEADQFGFSVSLSDDGMTLAASEPGFDGPAGDRSGNVRVFRYEFEGPKFNADGLWTNIGDIQGEESTDLFGVSVSLSGDGTRLAAGAPYHDAEVDVATGAGGAKAGRVRVFEYREVDAPTGAMEWTTLGDPMDGTESNDWFGWSVSLSSDGKAVASGAIRHKSGGYVRAYRLRSDDGILRWEKSGQEIRSELPDGRPDDRFGHSVALSANAERLVIGSPYSDPNGVSNGGMAIIYKRSSSESNGTDRWDPMGKPVVGKEESNQLGWSVAISDDSTHVVLGVPGGTKSGENTGSAVVQRWNEEKMMWDSAQALAGDKGEDDFGFCVAISHNGNAVGVGAPVQTGDNAGGTGYVRVFSL